MDYDYQVAPEALQGTRRWPVVVGLMSAFAGGALSATMLQHHAKRGDPMLLEAATPTFKAPTVTLVDEFIEKTLVPGSSLALTGGKSNKYEKLTYGTNGCPAGLEIKSASECWTAIQSLSLQATKTWDDSAWFIPLGCSVREAGQAGDSTGTRTFNSAGRGHSTGRGRADLAPICKKAGTCASCVMGSHLKNNECNPNVCQCPHGTAAAAPTCPHDGDKHCSSCAANYRLVGAVCKRVVCHCLDGRGARGAACPSHQAYKCSSCNADYHLVGIKCDPDKNLTMLAIGANESTN